MNVEAHPNIQAVAFTMDIMYSLEKNLRGDALEKKDLVIGDDSLAELITNFVVDVSTRIDEISKRA